MRKVNTTITLDPRDKKEGMELLSSFGLDLSTFVTLALKQMIHEQKIPFEISRDIPNAETRKAIKEVKDISKNPKKYKSYSVTEALEIIHNA